MRLLPLTGLIVFALASSVWAGSDPARPAPAASVAAQAPSSLPQVRQRLSRDQMQVKRLEHDLAAQEAESRRAAVRQQQQDKAIADLERQLQAIKVAPAAGQP